MRNFQEKENWIISFVPSWLALKPLHFHHFCWSELSRQIDDDPTPMRGSSDCRLLQREMVSHTELFAKFSNDKALLWCAFFLCCCQFWMDLNDENVAVVKGVREFSQLDASLKGHDGPYYQCSKCEIQWVRHMDRWPFGLGSFRHRLSSSFVAQDSSTCSFFYIQWVFCATSFEGLCIIPDPSKLLAHIEAWNVTFLRTIFLSASKGEHLLTHQLLCDSLLHYTKNTMLSNAHFIFTDICSNQMSFLLLQIITTHLGFSAFLGTWVFLKVGKCCH